MFKKIAVASFILGAAVGPAWAQTPYAGLQTRPLKALSEQQIADLDLAIEDVRNGRVFMGEYHYTLGVFGDTKGQVVDESYRNDGPWLSEYDRTKWIANAAWQITPRGSV